MLRRAFFLTGVVGLLFANVACYDSDLTIAMTDNKFGSPQNADPLSGDKIFVGDQVVWQNGGSNTHTAHGALFDTGSVAPSGASASKEMGNAGTFVYACDFHPKMKSKLGVAPTWLTVGDPVAGVTVNVVWANSKFFGTDGAIPPGWSVDAEYRKPGKKKWITLAEDEPSATSGSFAAEKKGKYKFRARLQNASDSDLSSGWAQSFINIEEAP